ncbi:MAG: acyl-CoA dehydrogenase [Alphaproteobacteria bacterium]|jgi:acyl-CoA dehydrogenase
MDFSLNEEQTAWQMKARKFAQEEIAPISLARDQIADPADTIDWELVKKGSKLGFRTAVVSKEQGGHGIDYVTQALVMTELAKADSAMSKTFSQCWKWSHLIAAVCTDDQKERFLKPFLADDTFVLGSGQTEANSGSDNRLPPQGDLKAGVRLRAERDGDDWILNGEKQFIAHGNVAKLFFLIVRTDFSVPFSDGTTLLLVPGDTPGFSRGKVYNKSGWRFYQNGEMVFENARVPVANQIGETNGALRKGDGDSSGDMFGDLELAANALGICDAACEKALALASTPVSGGEPLQAQQLVRLKIGRMNMLTEALRSYVMRVAWEHDQKVHSTNAGLAMNLSTDTVQEVTELCMDIHDNAGGPMDRGVDKLVRDSFIWSHLAGDSVQRLKVAGRVLK